MESPLASAVVSAIPERKKSLLAKYYVGTVVKVLLYVLLLAVALSAYCKMMRVMQLLHTMLVGWSIMLEVLISSNVLEGPEKLQQLIQVIMMYTGGI